MDHGSFTRHMSNYRPIWRFDGHGSIRVYGQYFTPTTLGNKCIVKLRCEDSQGAVSLGEVYIYVDNVPIYFPPYVVSKLQSKQVAAVDDSVDFSLASEPQEQMITVAWSDSSCGTLDHTAVIVSSQIVIGYIIVLY